MQRQWSASMICANIIEFKESIRKIEESEINYYHIDVMDGIFVPRLGMYPEMVQILKTISTKKIEIHLMVVNPLDWIDVFADAGADIISVHYESSRTNLLRVIEKIKNHNLGVGIALNPLSDFEGVLSISSMVDYLLLMGINPGVIGQQLKPFIVDKILKYKKLLASNNQGIKIILDGGVNLNNYEYLFEKGADILVGGSQTIFRSGNTIEENLKQLTLNRHEKTQV